MLIVKMVMLVLFVVILVISGSDASGNEPKSCKIYHLNGTANGESWTPSVHIKSLVNVVLKNPNPEAWREINLEFESKSGANVGTLTLKRKSKGVTLTLNRWSTTVHRDFETSQTFVARGSLHKLHGLRDWVYVNVTAAGNVRVSSGEASALFKQVNAKTFKSLYVRVPEGQDLDVGFNCVPAKILATAGMTTPLPEALENTGMVITVVGIILAVLLVGVFIFWYIGRKKRNVLVEKMRDIEKDNENRCEECGDSIHDHDHDDGGFVSGNDNHAKREEAKALLNDTDRCDDCGDEIVENSNEKDKSDSIDVEKDADICNDCSDVIEESNEKDKSDSIDVEKDADKCDDCGDVIEESNEKDKSIDMEKEGEKGAVIDDDTDIDTSTTKPGNDDIGQPVEGECSCSEEEHQE